MPRTKFATEDERKAAIKQNAKRYYQKNRERILANANAAYDREVFRARYLRKAHYISEARIFRLIGIRN